MDKGPAGRRSMCQNTCIGFIDTLVAERPCSGRRQKRQGSTRPVYDSNRQACSNVPPPLPSMERLETICPHDPDEVNARIARENVVDGLSRETGLKAFLESGNADAAVSRQFLAETDPFPERQEDRTAL